ncbi:hypothetical protein B0H19DRAFT_1255892 [Mycena capillaripes]|nr:hypothetical protein B0H19DRAFT_1255892 [Mycena capillaripes]
MIPSVGLLISLAFTLLLCNGPSTHVHARSVLRPQRSTISRRDTDATSTSMMQSASWIWAADSNVSSTDAAFVKNFQTPLGKTASSAVIVLTAVSNWTLWINGQPIGMSDDVQNGWKTGHVLRAALNASVNTFSILVTNGPNNPTPPPGLVVAVQVLYNDFTTSTVLSDSTWLATKNIPSDFSSLAEVSDLPQFAPAVVEGPYGSQPWGNSVTFPPTDTSLTLDNSTWIWSTPNASINADVAIIGFRKTFASPAGKRAVSANILLTVDNTFSLHVNGIFVGSPPGTSDFGWQYAQQFTNVPLNAVSNVFTVIAENFQYNNTSPNPASFIAAIEVLYTDTTVDIIRTDTTWLNTRLGSLSIFLSTPDNQLSQSVAQGTFGVAPWGKLLGISDALRAASVPAGPFSSDLATSPSAPASPPVGTIVAAVVGGVGALIVVGLLLLLLWRRPRNGRTGDKEALTAVPVSEFSASTLSVVPTLNPFNPEPPLPPPKPNVESVTRQTEGMRAFGEPDLDPELPPPSYDASVETEPGQSVAGGSQSVAGSFVPVRPEKAPW